jgi:hypothetical protein
MKTLHHKNLYDPHAGTKLLTVKESAEHLNYHPFSIYRLVMQGVLKPYRKAGKTLLFLIEDLDRFRLSSSWAARKASVEKPPVPPHQPPSVLTAKIKIDFGLGLMFQSHFEPIENFTWDQIPLVRARVDSKYGNKPFNIEIKSPDGGLWTVSYEPPTWLEKLAKKLKKGLKK